MTEKEKLPHNKLLQEKLAQETFPQEQFPQEKKILGKSRRLLKKVATLEKSRRRLKKRIDSSLGQQYLFKNTWL